jgi:hypothetical protein
MKANPLPLIPVRPKEDLMKSAAATVRDIVSAFPKNHFPAIHPPGGAKHARAIFQSQ